jgi:hypothetical protein
MNSTSRDSRSTPLGLGQRGLQLRPTVGCVRALAGFHLDVFANDLERLGVGEHLHGLALGTKAEARLALAARGNPRLEDYFRFHEPPHVSRWG